MALEIKEDQGFKYIDEGSGQPMVLLHGLFGALSNWEKVVETFSGQYRVLIPLLPVYDMPLKQSGLDGLVAHVEKFVALKSLTEMILVGNSLGGHVGLIYTLAHQASVNKLVLTGSSGLFENTMGGSFPKRGSYDYIKERIEYTFYDPKTATKELIDEVFETTKSIPKCLRIVAMAKSAQRHNMAKELHKIKVPTLLVWGLNDTITPPMVGHEFNKLIPNSELKFIDKCCHAPMMERADEFNEILKEYLNTH
jgi:pimeloyl-ACP methyl ester carboxylesterase